MAEAHIEKKFKLKHLPSLFANAFKAWNDDDPWRLSAVVAYYAVLSLPGLIVILINVVGSIWGPEIVQGHLTDEISTVLGQDAADTIKVMITETLNTEKNIISTLIGIASIIFGATGVFYQLQISLNKIWKIEDSGKFSFKRLLTDRARSFAFILVIGFLLLISFMVTAILGALNTYIKEMFPNIVLYVAYLLDLILSVSVVTTLFALMFKYMPDTQIRWKTVWIGAFITAILFTLGKYLLGLYFGTANPGSTYGAAGTIVLILLWVSYSCLIFFYGAAFTRVFSLRYGHDSHTLSEILTDIRNEDGLPNNQSV
ncbi:YihY/virulence factor BrkB family protein [Gelidibacter salicanalis]|uniref:YihY/virulence factor BrkB family protein n=1 Tax=Gelidibacter salicanalis TaxID=291193 RepID=A0A934NJD2_9FLAO|nr:YihY/virulence factor BrkB family protein [Gelidibacter salicanalis]MBJ7882358.1 YihY/virulence factor BrkB family protein [Gelidibacter salicanalis]